MAVREGERSNFLSGGDLWLASSAFRDKVVFLMGNSLPVETILILFLCDNLGGRSRKDDKLSAVV